jgi:hypothetical protein
VTHSLSNFPPVRGACLPLWQAADQFFSGPSSSLPLWQAAYPIFLRSKQLHCACGKSHTKFLSGQGSFRAPVASRKTNEKLKRSTYPQIIIGMKIFLSKLDKKQLNLAEAFLWFCIHH